MWSTIGIVLFAVFAVSGLFFMIGIFVQTRQEESGCLTLLWLIFSLLLLIFSFGVDYFFLPHAGRWIYWFYDPNNMDPRGAFFRVFIFIGSVTLAFFWLVELLTYTGIIDTYTKPDKDK